MASIVDERGYNQGFTWSKAQQVRMTRRAQAITTALNLKADARIIELGCGTGELAKLLSTQTEAEVTGVDLSPAFIERASRTFSGPKLSYATADLSKEEDVKRLGSQFDAVVGNGILHHLVNSLTEVLVQLKAVLKPGGQLVFWEPNLFNPYVYAIFSFGALRKLAKLEPDEMAFTPAFILRHLEAAGFRGSTVEFRDFLVPVVPEPLIGAVATVGDVLEKLPVVNRLAQSLFIVARKEA